MKTLHQVVFRRVHHAFIIAIFSKPLIKMIPTDGNMKQIGMWKKIWQGRKMKENWLLNMTGRLAGKSNEPRPLVNLNQI